MVEGPCAHVVLHLCWFHWFINSYWVYIEVIRHQTQHSRLYSYLICTKFQVNSLKGYKSTCPANRPRQTLTSVTLKCWSNQKPGYNVMYPY
jgi:hypothetical protein